MRRGVLPQNKAALLGPVHFTSIGYQFTSDGKLCLSPRRRLPSPDEGDAIALCFTEAALLSPEGSPSLELWPSSIQFKEMTAELPELGVLVSRLASLHNRPLLLARQ